jgi:pimeloyl-ACP methyl ester carboxylesterase
MVTLAIIVALFGAGAIITAIGTRLMNRIKPPRGRFIDVGGFRQHIVEMGHSRDAGSLPVVLLHGSGCNLEDMDMALGAQLAARHRVILVDRPGAGFSVRKAGEGDTPDYQAAVLRRVLDQLGIDRAILVGHSWGGTLALTFALDYPDRVAGLVVIAPPTHPHLGSLTPIHKALATPIGRLLAHTLALPFGLLFMGPGVRNAFRPQSMPPRYVRRSAMWLVLRPKTLMAHWTDIAKLEAFLARQAARYGKLTAPTTAIAGDRDTLVPMPFHSGQLAAAAPHVKLVVLNGYGHMLHHAAAERVVAAVEGVISSAAGATDAVGVPAA